MSDKSDHFTIGDAAMFFVLFLCINPIGWMMVFMGLMALSSCGGK